MLKITLLCLAPILLLSYSLNSYFNSDLTLESAYKVLKVIGPVEIRAYKEQIYASYTPTSSDDRGNSFRTVAGYIFGKNSLNEKIAMTSPVVLKPTNNYEMAFIMPDTFTLTSLPVPDDLAVKIYPVSSSTKAAIRYSGYTNEAKEAEHRLKLIDLLIENKISFEKDFEVRVYDAPYKLFGRRNEIVVSINLNSEKMLSSDTSDKIYLGGGCFWCVEAVFENVIGVKNVDSGYSGGKLKNPTYNDIAYGNTQHAEVCEITYAKDEIDLESLLKVFFATHDPTTLNRQGHDFGAHYRSIILYKDEAQLRVVNQVIKELNSSVFDQKIVTQVQSFDAFYIADISHQNYYENNKNAPYCSIVISPKIEKLKNDLAQYYK